MVSRVLGFVRDVVIARYFGATIATDAFFVAFKIPNLFRRLFAEGAFATAFVPVLSEAREKEGANGVLPLLSAVSGVLGAALLVVTIFGVLAAPGFITVFAPGFIGDADKFPLASDMLRITFPYLLFISLTALCASVLNTYGRFAIPALTPALLNIALIAAALWLAPQFPERQVLALAWGVFAGGVLQLSVQLIAVYRLGLLRWPRFAADHPGVKKVLTLMGPAVFGVSVGQINLMIDQIIASMLQTGSISWLYYADRLMEFPLGVFGVAIGTVILPALSREHAAQSSEAFSKTLDWGLRVCILIGLPSAVGLAILAGPALSTLFQYGAFEGVDVTQAARALIAYSFGLLAFMLVKVLAPGFYARQDTRTPVRIAVIAMVSNIVLNLILVFPLQHAGLALATAIAAYINAALLLRALIEARIFAPQAGWRRFLISIALSVTAMAVVLWFFLPPWNAWTGWEWHVRGWRLLQAVALGAVVYIGGIFITGAKPLQVLRG